MTYSEKNLKLNLIRIKAEKKWLKLLLKLIKRRKSTIPFKEIAVTASFKVLNLKLGGEQVDTKENMVFKLSRIANANSIEVGII